MIQPHQETEQPIYLQPERPMQARLDDLLSRLTLEEKIDLMVHKSPGVPRLGIPAYNYWNEALHGVARNGRATVFPQAIGMAATWDTRLIEQVGSAIGDEARAKHHAALRANGRTDYYQGLTFWSPNVNIFRDPRWGRGQETWGEDPRLTSLMAGAFVRGLQGDNPRYLKAAACAKHYAVHSGPEKDRHQFNARVSARELHDTYLPAFKHLVTEAKIEAVMGAYNRTLDEPCCGSRLLLQDLLREAWGFDGHVVSDCGALEDFHKNHQVTADAAESAALALRHGCDLDCGGVVFRSLPEAIERGLVSESDVDRALARTLRTRFRLGMFDPPERVPYSSTPASVVASPAHRRLARQAAVKSMVLLKNDGDLLPVAPNVRSIFVVGPTAANMDVLLGNYYGLNDEMTTFVEGIVGAAPEGVRINYLPGCQLVHPNLNAKDWSYGEARTSDLTVVCMGLSPQMEGEEGSAILSPQNGDRDSLHLPEVQMAYLRALADRSQRIVLVLSGGGPIELGEIAELVQAIIWVWYPGQAGGQALADILFGRSTPSGRLPITFPRSLDDLPAYDDYGMAGRTYRYATTEPMYPFGFGLSYTRFAYDGLRLSLNRVPAGESVRATCRVTNTGEHSAEEVVQVYLRDVEASVPVPHQKLVGFKRVRLKPAQTRRLSFDITPEMMSVVDEAGRWQLEPGRFELTIGGCSPGRRGLALGAPEPVSAEFSVTA
jgi:beta-glucosidase